MNIESQTLPSVWLVPVFDAAGEYQTRRVFSSKEKAEEYVANTPPTSHKFRIVECLPPAGAAEWHSEYEGVL